MNHSPNLGLDFWGTMICGTLSENVLIAAMWFVLSGIALILRIREIREGNT